MAFYYSPPVATRMPAGRSLICRKYFRSDARPKPRDSKPRMRKMRKMQRQTPDVPWLFIINSPVAARMPAGAVACLQKMLSALMPSQNRAIPSPGRVKCEKCNVKRRPALRGVFCYPSQITYMGAEASLGKHRAKCTPSFPWRQRRKRHLQKRGFSGASAARRIRKHFRAHP